MAPSGRSVEVSSRKIASCGPSITMRYTAFFFSAMPASLLALDGNGCVLEPVFEPGEGPGPVRAELGGPAVVDHVDRHGVEPHQALAADLLRDDEVRALERVEVLHHR